MIEILAPCGGEDSLPAALNSGADAVYLGASSFSARRNAGNFDSGQLRSAVRECHRCGVKVYVTLNTLVFDDELDRFTATVRDIADAGADAVIVQDPGAAQLIKRTAPQIRLHASTQMTVTSASGAEFARKNGFSRVVLAREMSLDEIARVTRNVDIETEVFVHGALCVCVSGQCLMSAMLGGRSGNRGLCAQPCRLDFTLGERHNVLSLKDLSVIDRLPELEKIGVTSAKIEGRMKRPEYVAAAVTACRDVLDGRKPDLDGLRAVFSRSGFTGAYLDGSLKDMQGIRTKEDVLAAAPALKEMKRLYDEPYKRRVIDVTLEIRAGREVNGKISCGEYSAEHSFGIVPEPALKRSITAAEVEERLRKTGGTIYDMGSVRVDTEDGLMLTAAAINAVRREIIALVDDYYAH